MGKNKYLMESEEESYRLDIKIDEQIIEKHAGWAGIKPGMKVADFGCGPGKITSILHKLVQPGGTVIGLDGSSSRLQYAREKYGRDGVEFVEGDIVDLLGYQDEFDFIWVRFVLEYYRSNSFDIVQNFYRYLKPGGILCLIDLDHNPINYYGISSRLERTFKRVMLELEEKFNFDPYVGRKLYSFLYDLECINIDVEVETYKLIFGDINDIDAFNLMKKVEVIPRTIDFDFDEYEGGYEEFYSEIESFFSDPRRFAYTPLIIARGRKPAD